LRRAGHVGGVISGVAEDANRSVGDEDVWEDYRVSVVVFVAVSVFFFSLFENLSFVMFFIVTYFNLMEKNYYFFLISLQHRCHGKEEIG